MKTQQQDSEGCAGWGCWYIMACMLCVPIALIVTLTPAIIIEHPNPTTPLVTYGPLFHWGTAIGILAGMTWAAVLIREDLPRMWAAIRSKKL